MEDSLIKFPSDFIFGVSTSAYQIEGSHNTSGKGESIWDRYCHTPGRVTKRQNGDIACDHYSRFKEDIALLKLLGYRHYRFSISWTRLLPQGRDQINEEGVKFYNNLINELIKNNITPYITLYHWDLPQALYDEYQGWIDRRVIADFTSYSLLCFRLFGDRVHNWITFNEPWCIAVLGYGTGEQAPGRSEYPGIEPYLVAHNILIAHGRVVKIFREIFINDENYKIGMTLNVNWWEPNSRNSKDISAGRRALDFTLGWFADPLYFGDYPDIMKETVKERLPVFSKEESEEVKDSMDFFGINHYTTLFCGEHSNAKFFSNMGGILDLSPTKFDGLAIMWNTLTKNSHYYNDLKTMIFTKESYEMTDMRWNIVPFGIRKLLEYCYNVYNPKGGLYIFENGCATDGLEDTKRINYLRDYIKEVKKAMVNGVDVRGYFVWSLLDNFEWGHGYEKRFGLIYVDYKTLKRYPKDSAYWYSKLCKSFTLD